MEISKCAYYRLDGQVEIRQFIHEKGHIPLTIKFSATETGAFAGFTKSGFFKYKEAFVLVA